MNDYRLINIVGIDGSGKTTLSKGLAELFCKKGISLNYKYCQYFAKLLFPMKMIAKITVMRKTNEHHDYTTYNQTKRHNSQRFKLLAKVYSSIWVIDYIFQIFFKIVLPINLFSKKLIVDRYIYDSAVNISLTMNMPVDYTYELVDRFLSFCPKPQKVIYIDLPEEVAFSRKNDIQSIEYLRERRERYLSLAQKFGFEIVDGTLEQSQLLSVVSSSLLSLRV